MDELLSTNIVTVTLVIKNFGGPRNAVDLIKDRLKVPAVENMSVVDIETNYVLHNEPGYFQNVSEMTIQKFNQEIQDERS